MRCKKEKSRLHHNGYYDNFKINSLGMWGWGIKILLT